MLNYLYAHSVAYYCCVLICSVVIPLITIPSILHVARKRHLYDDLGHFRKKHDQGIPRLGGVAIFVSFTITVLMFGTADKVMPVNCLISACIILLAMGLKDDLYGVNPNTKFLIQFIVALVLVVCGDIRVKSFDGVLDIWQLPYIISVVLSIFSIILIINAFNLIDGIDGLAATLGILANATFAIAFMYLHQYQFAAISLAMIGSLFGFLKFNITPAKIFMGDTGSLLIGLVSAIMGIELVNHSYDANTAYAHWFSFPALVVAAFITPLFDTTRVFIIRILAGKSPFTADRNHIHHRLLKLSLTHLQATSLLAGVNIAVILVVVSAGVKGVFTIIVGILVVYVVLDQILKAVVRNKKRERFTFSSQAAGLE